MTTTKTRRDPATVVLTRTAPRPADPARYRGTWGNARECAHRWAANKVSSGRAGNVFFADGVIYSYGQHFPIARWVVPAKGGGAPVVLLTTGRYSNTTAHHIGDVRHAIPRDATVFHVPNVRADTRGEHRLNLKHFELRALDALERSRKARKYTEQLRNESLGYIRTGNEYAEFVGLRERLGSPTGEDLEKWAAGVAAAAEKEQAAIKVREAKARKERQEKLAKDVAEWERKVEAWVDGGDWPGDYPVPFADVPARIRIKGNVLETSMRAAVPLRAAMPILKAVRDGSELPAGFEVDGFQVRVIDRQARTVRIGCHTVAFDEIERLARRHNL